MNSLMRKGVVVHQMHIEVEYDSVAALNEGNLIWTRRI